MKRTPFLLSASAIFIAVGLSAGALQAQTPPPAPPQGGEHHHPNPLEYEAYLKHLDFLTPEQKQKLKLAYEDVIANHPDLKAQGEALKAEGKALHENPNATKEDRHAFFEKVKTHLEALKAAMIQEDPSTQPILEQIEQHRKDFEAKHPHPQPPAQ